MTIIADSGSTKTDWVLCNGSIIVKRVKTQGLNPTIQSSDEILAVLKAELADNIDTTAPQKIFFYGAGCAYDTANNRMKQALEAVFTTKEIEIYSDLLASARALCGHEEGIACILGTGSNSCLYDGKNIIDNTPSMGYILGDEGSGAHLGRQLVSDCVKKQLPKAIIFPASAQEKFNLENIFDAIVENLPVAPAWYDKDVFTDKNLRFFASEIVREKIFLNYKEEIPYSCEVEIEEFKEGEERYDIGAVIYVMRDTQKGIIIGKGGQSLKKVGTQARIEMEDFFQKKVFLKLFVKVDPDWRESKKELRRFGYEY